MKKNASYATGCASHIMQIFFIPIYESLFEQLAPQKSTFVKCFKWLTESLKFKGHNNDHGNKTKFTDLCADIIFLIFEELDLYSLLNAAHTNQQLSFFAADTFRRKFGDKTVVIGSLTCPDHYYDDSDDDSSLEGIGFEILSKVFNIFDWKSPEATIIPEMVYGDIIEVKDVELSLKLLKIFGIAIRKLRIYYRYLNSNQSMVVSQFINQFCAESLVHFEVSHCNGNTLNRMTRPFEKLESAYFAHQLDKMESSQFSFDKLFPNLRRLSLGFVKDLNERYIDCHLPNLKHFHLHMGFGETSQKSRTLEKKFERFIRKNPQIESIFLRNLSYQFLSILNVLLPNLKSLFLHTLYFESQMIRFDKLTKLTIRNCLGSPENILFSNLREFSMNCDENCKTWITFFGKHSNLRRLDIVKSNINDETLRNVTKRLTFLQEMSLCLSNGRFIRAETIVELMETHEHLRNFSITPCKMSDEHIFRSKLGSHWKIISNGELLCFERENECCPSETFFL